MLDLVLQIGPCRAELTGCRLLRIRGGSDQPAVVAAIERAGGELDGSGDFWWIEARRLRGLANELLRAADPLFHTGPIGRGGGATPTSPRPPTRPANRRPAPSR
jgi:hypothetical protein